MTRILSLFLALAVGGCSWGGAPVPLPPPPPGPVFPPPAPPVTPPIDGTFAVSAGMTRAQVEAVVGVPSFDPPENVGENVDVVGYDREGGSYMVVYRGGVVIRVVWAMTGPVR